MTALMTIGQAARAAETRPETIRYYERIGLLPAPPRSAANYRGYAPADVSRLAFVRRARELGFPLEQVRELVSLAGQDDSACCDVDALTRRHARSVERKIADLSALKRELDAMLGACGGGRVADCRILEALVPAA